MALFGYPRDDGLVGFRNLLVVASMSDLANDVALRIAAKVDSAVCLLTPTGGLSIAEELEGVERLRSRMCTNPNVGAVLVVGPFLADLERLAAYIGESGRPAETLYLLDAVDSQSALLQGLQKLERLAEILRLRRRTDVDASAFRVGIRSSSSCAESVATVNPLIGKAIDRIIAGGGAVAFTELADLAGAVESVSARGASDRVCTEIGIALGTVRKQLLKLAAAAPDPTPTNKLGGLTTLEEKSRGSLRRLGNKPIDSILRFGEELPGHGLHMIDGPGSASISLVGFAAAGCNLVLYTVGMSSAIATCPLMPVVKVGPRKFLGSNDVDVCITGDACEDDVLQEVATVAAGKVSISERDHARHLMIPNYVGPL